MTEKAIKLGAIAVIEPQGMQEAKIVAIPAGEQWTLACRLARSTNIVGQFATKEELVAKLRESWTWEGFHREIDEDAVTEFLDGE